MSKKFLCFLILTIVFISSLSRNTYAGHAPKISDIGNLKTDEPKTVTVSGLDPNTRYYWKESRREGGIVTSSYETVFADCFTSTNGNSHEGILEQPIGPFEITGNYKLEIYRAIPSACEPVRNPSVSQKFTVGTLDTSETGTCEWAPDPPLRVAKDECKSGYTPTNEGTATVPKCVCRPPGTPGEIPTGDLPAAEKCKNKDDPTFHEGHDKPCTTSGGPDVICEGDPSNPGIRTAIGCIRTSPVGFVQDSLKFIIAISGGLAFLMMLLGAFQMLTSAGNPDTLQAGRDRFQSAIIGLLFVIFSILLLQIIGVDILKLPGFNR